jgi:hypothetical protein
MRRCSVRSWPGHARKVPTCSSPSPENRKDITHFERVYYSVITDAIEGGYAFNLQEEQWELDTTLAGNESFSKAVSRVLEMDDVITRFYTVAAEQSRGLMADVPKAFLLIARKRKEREEKLKALLA